MTDRPAASLPAGSAPEAEFFLARTEEQRRFRELLRSQVGLSRRRKLLNKIGLMRDDREPDPHPNSPWIFLFHGEGGMGKSTLIRRLQAIAEGKLRDKHPGDRAWVDRFTILKIDWENERRNRPSLQGQRDQIAESAVLDVLFDQAAQVDRSCFKDYEQRLKDLKAASKKVRDKLQTEQQGGSTGVSKALAIVLKVGLRWLKLDDVVKDYGDQIDAATEAATELAPQVKTWLQTQLNREELEVFERPDQVLADALGKGLAKLAARKPLLMILDTYEVVDRPECDAVVRLVMKAAGGRVSWVVAGRSNLRNSGKRGEVYFKGYGDDFPEAKIYAKALDEFGEAEIREYFARKVPDRPIDDADAQAIREFSLGIPFMVAEIVSIWRDCPQLSWQQILAPAPADDAKPPRDRAIAAMTERFLFHCLQQGRDEAARTALTQDLAAIYGLAIARRPDDRPLLRAMLQTKDLNPTLANLQARYSFVFADQCRLHDNLLAYLRPYLLAAAQRESPAVQGLNDRALAHLNERLAAKQQELPELGDRFESENAKALLLDAAHHHFWKAQDPDRDETAAWQFWLGVFVDAWLVDRAFAGELVQVLAGFERCLSADGRRRWGLIQDAWAERRNFDCDRRKAWLDELDKLARRGWLATDQHPERAATLELERARLLYGQKQDSAALQALEALDRRWADPSPSLREAIADLYDDFARRFLWPKSDTSPVSSPEGLQAAQRACALQPDRPGYLYNRAVALNGAKQHQEAAEVYQQVIALRPSAACYNGLGAVYRDLKQYEEAIAAYQQAITLDPNFVYAHNGLGNVYRDLKRYKEAIAAYQQAITLDPNDVYAHNGLGNAYLDLKRYEEAIAAYQKAIALDPSYVYSHSNLGLALADLQRYPEAEVAYRQALSIEERAFDFRNLGDVLKAQERYNEAIEAYQKAIEIDPENLYCYGKLTFAYQKLKRYEEAIEVMQNTMRLSEKVIELSDIESFLGNPENFLKIQEECGEEITTLQNAYSLGFSNLPTLVYNFLETLKSKQGDLAGAINAFQKAAELTPSTLDSAHYEEAIAAYHQTIALDPQNTLPYFGLGLLQFEQGELAGAIATFQKAAELDPTDKILPNNLGFLCLITDRIDEAETYLLRARELTPDYYMPAFNLAAVRALRSDLDSARSLLAESLQLCPKSDDQEQLHWSIISILLGNVEAGFEQLTTTLATLTNPTEMCVIRGGVLEASQAIARSPLQTPDLHRAIDLLQSHLTPQSTDP